MMLTAVMIVATRIDAQATRSSVTNTTTTVYYTISSWERLTSNSQPRTVLQRPTQTKSEHDHRPHERPPHAADTLRWITDGDDCLAHHHDVHGHEESLQQALDEVAGPFAAAAEDEGEDAGIGVDGVALGDLPDGFACVAAEG